MIEVFGECLETIRDIINNSNNKYKDAIAIQEKKNKKIMIDEDLFRMMFTLWGQN